MWVAAALLIIPFAAPLRDDLVDDCAAADTLRLIEIPLSALVDISSNGAPNTLYWHKGVLH
jgi:hypothetical protein